MSAARVNKPAPKASSNLSSPEIEWFREYNRLSKELIAAYHKLQQAVAENSKSPTPFFFPRMSTADCEIEF